MNLHPDLLATLTNLGVTADELTVLEGRMLFSVTALQASITALDAQIATLTAQRDEQLTELTAAQATAAKLVDPNPPADPAPAT